MKNTILYLLVLSFLMQSCYSYKTISFKEMPLQVGKNYKIRQETVFVKSKLKTVTDSIITVTEGKVQKDIAINSIKEIKVQEFSALKTVGCTLGLGLVIYGVIAIIELNNMDFGGGGSFGF